MQENYGQPTLNMGIIFTTSDPRDGPRYATSPARMLPGIKFVTWTKFAVLRQSLVSNLATSLKKALMENLVNSRLKKEMKSRDES